MRLEVVCVSTLPLRSLLIASVFNHSGTQNPFKPNENRQTDISSSAFLSLRSVFEYREICGEVTTKRRHIW